MQPPHLPTLTAEVVTAINRARAERGEEPIDNHGRTPNGRQAYELRTTDNHVIPRDKDNTHA